MNNALQSTVPTENIQSSQVHKTSLPKRPINYLTIIFIASLLILITSTAILAYQSYQKNLVISQFGLQDYFYGNSDSVTLKQLFKVSDLNTRIETAFTKEALALRLQQIQDEAIKTAVDNALAQVNTDTESAASTRTVETNVLDKQISFTVPNNFSKESIIDEINMPAIILKSSDFKYSADINFASGIYIVIIKEKAEAGYQISNEDNETSRRYLSDFKITTVGGKPAAYGFLDFEIYIDRYIVLNNEDKWTIYIQYGGNSPEETSNIKRKYKNEIEQFIGSISFK